MATVREGPAVVRAGEAEVLLPGGGGTIMNNEQ